MTPLVAEIRDCTLCEEALEHGVRPVLQASSAARILIAGQAPGSKVHRTGIPFDDPSSIVIGADQLVAVPMGGNRVGRIGSRVLGPSGSLLSASTGDQEKGA